MREFYVIQLGRPQDPNKFVEMPQQAPQEAQVIEEDIQGFGLAQLRGAPQRRAAQPPQPRSFVVKNTPNDRSGFEVHTSLEGAEEYAKHLAAKNPKTMYGIFSCVKVLETTEPTVISKSYNDAGELVINKE